MKYLGYKIIGVPFDTESLNLQEINGLDRKT